MTDTFNLENWKRRFADNAAEAERNSLMDSGWSASVADKCLRRSMALYRELVAILAETKTLPQDLFDRPELVAVQEAARFSITETA